MKLNKFLIPLSIVSLASASVSLIGCGGLPTPEKVQFSSIKGSMSSTTQGTFVIDWTHTDHNLKFKNDWEFSCSYGTAINVAADDARPKTITITFANEVKPKITNGKLKFTYDDLTTKENDIEVTISNIHLARYIPDPVVPENIKTYIQDRTFSLMAFPVVTDGSKYFYGGYFCYGTGWIIDDATPSDYTDYKYYVATNWHVIDGFKTVSDHDFSPYTYVTTYYAYGDLTSSSNPENIIDSIKDYTLIGSKGENYTEEPDRTTFMYTPTSENRGIDLYEATINFACSKQGTVPSVTIKEKLDKLNQYRKTEGHITKFVKGDDPAIIAKTKYVGGYPYKEGYDAEGEAVFGGKWEYHQIVSDLQYIETPWHKHTVGETTSIKDCSSQYESDLDMPLDWMDGGASGSMLITEDCEVCGIYWGGWETIGEEEFYPSFSIFNTSGKNFLDKYINTPQP